ncbi:MAG: N-methyl-L-tryptophan oxidase [Zavarzinella sp.]
MGKQVAEIAVVGGGIMGSAIAWQLAQAGLRPVVFEQYTSGHQMGSSHGASRVIRTAYFEHPTYVPMVQHAFQQWERLQQETGQLLLTHSPCINIGQSDGALVAGVMASAKQHQLAIEQLAAPDLMQRFPQFHIPDDFCGVLEHRAGILHVENCLNVLQAKATQAGATFVENAVLKQILPTDNGFELHFQDGSTCISPQLVVCAGAWLRGLMRQLGSSLPLTVMRQTMHWFLDFPLGNYQPDQFPIFLVDSPQGIYYGMPMIDELGVKVAQHYGAPELLAPPDDRHGMPDDASTTINFLQQWLPGISGKPHLSKVCLYTLTPDRHFLIDHHPDWPNLIVAGGFSGHGFKFAPTIGKMVLEMVQHRSPTWDRDLFCWR